MDTETRTTIQYEIRTIDSNGEVIDNPWMEDGRGSRARIQRIFDTLEPDDEIAAFVLERVTVKGCESEGVEDMDYETVATKGDESALHTGEWI